MRQFFKEYEVLKNVTKNTSFDTKSNPLPVGDFSKADIFVSIPSISGTLTLKLLSKNPTTGNWCEVPGMALTISAPGEYEMSTLQGIGSRAAFSGTLPSGSVTLSIGMVLKV